MIRANYHTHSIYCDGKNKPEEIVSEALKKGFEHLGFSGHMDPGVHMDFAAYEQEIRRIQEVYADRLEILRGVELDNLYDPSCAPDVEFIIGSTHFIPAPGSSLWKEMAPAGTVLEGGARGDEIIGVDGSIQALTEGCRRFWDGDFYRMSAAYYEFETSVVARLHPSFIGHFDLITRFNQLPAEEGGEFLDETSSEYLKPAFHALDLLAREGIPFELNMGAFYRGRRNCPYPRKELLTHLRDLDARIVLSADAHEKEHLDGGFAVGTELLKECGYEKAVILTRQETDLPAANTRAKGQGVEGNTLYWKEITL